jgi:molybdopterin synthase catalytic subunit
MRVHVQSEPFDAGDELNKFTQACGNVGAVVSFSGITRDVEGGLSEMEIEHYPGMTEKALSKIVEEAISRWNLDNAMVIHRHGRLGPRDIIMMVAAASKHRSDAFEAANFLMDYLISRAPFWKTERTSYGSDWVA